MFFCLSLSAGFLGGNDRIGSGRVERGVVVAVKMEELERVFSPEMSCPLAFWGLTEGGSSSEERIW